MALAQWSDVEVCKELLGLEELEGGDITFVDVLVLFMLFFLSKLHTLDDLTKDASG